MTDFTIHSVDSAPADAKPLLQGSQQQFGFVPNLLGIMAEAPIALQAYLTLNGLLEKSSFSAADVQCLILAISTENGCDYCIAAHQTIAHKLLKVPAEVIDAIRNNQPLADAKLNALVVFAKAIVAKRGFVDDSEVAAFLQAGHSKTQVLEVITAIAMKTLSNYINHIAKTPIDEQFSG